MKTTDRRIKNLGEHRKLPDAMPREERAIRLALFVAEDNALSAAARGNRKRLAEARQLIVDLDAKLAALMGRKAKGAA